ncbi:HAMP domain-containing histidine kinase [Synechococcus sp. A10-1-5-1]|uniref:sensor histidine kinase n=1 Tax=Synechococcus sp. A10-1-5-1 TaxID=2936507 RepID=UPI0020008DE1|nr:HAMP domain-containing sensor histidine kinase [Synechococcus sp. A10-1-5-1]UPM49139.1 HAMP domain-containing histidine kinase [Synechococcus sp. A10-1-5-1]
MQVSKRFLALLKQQLAQFADRPDLRTLVVYVALPSASGEPSLLSIGEWPQQALVLESGVSESSPGEGSTRRWLALRDGPLLLGALRIDTDCWPWPRPLSDRLEATALCLTEALKLDLDQQRLGRQLALRDDQLKLLVHQVRNPLAALRTFGQLLRRRLDGDSANQALVDNLLSEQHQINRYLDAIDQLSQTPLLPPAEGGLQPLLLPPAFSSDALRSLNQVLEPLMERAAGTASLQGRRWVPPGELPTQPCNAAAVSEIVANLLENAFRYSRPGGRVGLLCQEQGDQLVLAVWDEGPEIPDAERKQIFQKGTRGSTGSAVAGSGLGLALGRDLAERIGGALELLIPPSCLDPALPNTGNAFQLSLPKTPPQPTPTASN